MSNSQNGWIANDASQVASQLVPGTTVKLTVRKDAAGLVLLLVAAAFDKLVEDIDNGRGGLDDWGFAVRPIRGGVQLSNHSSGTAIDLNATRHALGTAPSKSYTPGQIEQIHRIVAATFGTVRWGGDYGDPQHGGVAGSRPDSMHFEINDHKTIYDCIHAVDSMRDFLSKMPSPVVDLAASSTPTPPAQTVTLNVTNLQRFAARAFPAYAKGLVADGVLGPATVAFIKEFQRRSGLAPDGIIGPLTLAALRNNGFKG